MVRYAKDYLPFGQEGEQDFIYIDPMALGEGEGPTVSAARGLQQ